MKARCPNAGCGHAHVETWGEGDARVFAVHTKPKTNEVCLMSGSRVFDKDLVPEGAR